MELASWFGWYAISSTEMIKRNIYKWHRWLSVSVAIPVIMWTVSGITHPIMTSFKPKIKNQFIKSSPLDTSKISISLKVALQKNNITSVINFRIIELNNKYYYQVKLKENDELAYLSATNGVPYPDGDKQYAVQLAKKILGDTSRVTAINSVESFDEEYVYINRLLPVYKVNFDRKDGIRIYIDTYGSRLALAMDDGRRAFGIFFMSFHSFGFLDCFGNFRLLVLILLSVLSFLTACLGIYIWFIISRKRKNINEKTKYKRWHGSVAIFTSLTTLLFTFSGAFHTFKKYTPDTRQNYFYEPEINAEKLNVDFSKIIPLLSENATLTNVSIIKMDEKYYWQVYQKGKKDLLFKLYMDINDYTVLENGEEKYATFLANTFSGNQGADISGTKQIEKFEGEYGFANKRLPVMKVQYTKNDNERYYVETSSGKLSVKVQDKDLLEGYSFSMFHKYHFIDFAGKTSRDVATVIAATANLLVTILGIALFIRFIRNRNRKK